MFVAPEKQISSTVPLASVFGGNIPLLEQKTIFTAGAQKQRLYTANRLK